MKKILTALAIVGMTYSSAIAQSSQINVCGVKQNKVCVVSKDRKTTSCYKTKFAENFQVCKNENGYYICCETPGDNNSTFSRYLVHKYTNSEGEQYQYSSFTGSGKAANMTVPQNQSYVNIPIASK